MALGGKLKLKPAFRTSTKLAQAAEDYSTASHYGPLMVGAQALYLYDFYQICYIPLEELASIEMDTEANRGCGGGCCAHEVRVIDTKGKVFKTKVIKAEKIDQAVEDILQKQPTVQYVLSGTR